MHKAGGVAGQVQGWRAGTPPSLCSTGQTCIISSRNYCSTTAFNQWGTQSSSSNGTSCQRVRPSHRPLAGSPLVVWAIGSDRPGSSGGYGGRHPGSSSSGGVNGPHGAPRRSKPERKARTPGLFEIKVVTPPPRSLGIYALPPNTHNGEQIEIDGQGYVVTSLVLQYKLVKGKYVRDHSRLEVLPTSRYFLNMMLDDLVHARYMGPTGQQD